MWLLNSGSAMDNVPLGADSDPRAPWKREEREEDANVRVLETLMKEVDLRIDNDEKELFEVFRNQRQQAIEIIEDCQAICKQLMEDGHYRYAGKNVWMLCSSCNGWEQADLDATGLPIKKEKKKENNLIEFV